MIRNPRVMKVLGVSPETIIHVGAHHAQDHFSYEKWGAKRIVWFEADSNNVSWIRKNRPEIEVHHKFLWSKSGEFKTFYLHSDSSQSSANKPSRKEKTSTITLQTSTLDEEVGKLNFSKPVLLILDVQGSEAEVLAGATKLLAVTDFLVIELTEKNSRYEKMPDPKEIVKSLRVPGFRPTISKKSHDCTYSDVLFSKKWLIHNYYIKAFDFFLMRILSMRHFFLQGHLTYDHMNCSKCLHTL